MSTFTVTPAPNRPRFTRDSMRRRTTMAPPTRFSDVVPTSVLVSITPEELQRQEVVFELIKTEESYLADMRMTIQTFLTPIREREMLTKAQIGAVFSNLEALVPVNQSILMVPIARPTAFAFAIVMLDSSFFRHRRHVALTHQLTHSLTHIHAIRDGHTGTTRTQG